MSIKDKNIPIEVLEDIAGGINHALIGNKIAIKWKFPRLVSEVIRCHHDPKLAESHPDSVFLVYLANVYTYYNKEKMVFENIEKNVLEFFEINDPAKIDEIGKKLIDAYENR